MRQRAPGGDAPAAFGRALNELAAARDREKQRRRQLGDTASVERFERELAQRSAALSDWGWDERAARARGYVGFWGWVAPAIAEIEQAFLRGDDMTAPGAQGATPQPGHRPAAADEEVRIERPINPTTGKRIGPTEPFWTPQDDHFMWEFSKPPVRLQQLEKEADRVPQMWTLTPNHVMAAVNAEVARRQAKGDPASVDQYNQTMERLVEQWRIDPDFFARAEQEISAALARGEKLGWWTWIPPEIASTMQAFIRREDIGEPYDGDPVIVRLPADPSEAPAPAAPAVPRPERWEPDWSPDEDVTMRKWADKGGGAVPDCFQSNLKHMLDAIERERQRRRQIGDVAGVDLYDLRKDLIINAATGNPAELMRETARTRAPGFWAFLPGKLGQLNQAFLRGDLPEVKDPAQTPVRKTTRW